MFTRTGPISSQSMTDPAKLLERFVQRDRRAAGRDSYAGRVGASTTAAGTDASKPLSRVVGLTGSGGAGKSTLVAALVTRLRSQDLSVAVLACDPQSPVTGGAC